MPDIIIAVKNKIANKTDDSFYICGNSDFRVVFDFDDEWGEYDVKTARFSYNDSYTDIVFSGDVCDVPIISDTFCFNVGVFAGNLHTTTAARVPCRKSILCGGGAPEPPTEDVYSQIIGLCNDTKSIAESVRDDADEGKFNGKDGDSIIPVPTNADNDKVLTVKNGKPAWTAVKNVMGVAV